jgi:hypothetical protein
MEARLPPTWCHFPPYGSIQSPWALNLSLLNHFRSPLFWCPTRAGAFGPNAVHILAFYNQREGCATGQFPSA